MQPVSFARDREEPATKQAHLFGKSGVQGVSVIVQYRDNVEVYN